MTWEPEWPIEALEQKVQVLRVRTLTKIPLIEVLRTLGREGFTGKVQVNFNQGNIASVTAEERLPREF